MDDCSLVSFFLQTPVVKVGVRPFSPVVKLWVKLNRWDIIEWSVSEWDQKEAHWLGAGGHTGQGFDRVYIWLARPGTSSHALLQSFPVYLKESGSFRRGEPPSTSPALCLQSHAWNPLHKSGSLSLCHENFASLSAILHLTTEIINYVLASQKRTGRIKRVPLSPYSFNKMG